MKFTITFDVDEVPTEYGDLEEFMVVVAYTVNDWLVHIDLYSKNLLVRAENEVS